MLKETETEETIVFFVTFLSLAAIQLGGGGTGPWLRLWFWSFLLPANAEGRVEQNFGFFLLELDNCYTSDKSYVHKNFLQETTFYIVLVSF